MALLAAWLSHGGNAHQVLFCMKSYPHLVFDPVGLQGPHMLVRVTV